MSFFIPRFRPLTWSICTACWLLPSGCAVVPGASEGDASPGARWRSGAVLRVVDGTQLEPGLRPPCLMSAELQSGSRWVVVRLSQLRHWRTVAVPLPADASTADTRAASPRALALVQPGERVRLRTDTCPYALVATTP